MLYSRLIESGIIGLLAGGWASCTYWPGVSGAFLGAVAGLVAWMLLTIRHEEESRPAKKTASPYKKGTRLAGTRRV